MLGKLIKGMAGLRVVDQEHEIPDWMGALLDGGGLVKGAGHKYLRRVPKAGGGYRYFYAVTGGQGIGHASEMVTGAAFKVKHAGKEGHFHITADHGEEVTVRHDESGHEARMSKAALRAMLHAEHAEALGAVKARATKTLEQAKKTGTAKQQEKAAALVSKYGGASEEGPFKSSDKFDSKWVEKLSQDALGPGVSLKTGRDVAPDDSSRVFVSGAIAAPPYHAARLNDFLIKDDGVIQAGKHVLNQKWAESLQQAGIVPLKDAKGGDYLIWDRDRYVNALHGQLILHDPPLDLAQKRKEYDRGEGSLFDRVSADRVVREEKRQKRAADASVVPNRSPKEIEDFIKNSERVDVSGIKGKLSPDVVGKIARQVFSSLGVDHESYQMVTQGGKDEGAAYLFSHSTPEDDQGLNNVVKMIWLRASDSARAFDDKRHNATVVPVTVAGKSVQVGNRVG
jgi:hypothetical protein